MKKKFIVILILQITIAASFLYSGDPFHCNYCHKTVPSDHNNSLMHCDPCDVSYRACLGHSCGPKTCNTCTATYTGSNHVCVTDTCDNCEEVFYVLRGHTCTEKTCGACTAVYTSSSHVCVTDTCDNCEEVFYVLRGHACTEKTCGACTAVYTSSNHICETAYCEPCALTYYVLIGHTCPEPAELGTADQAADTAAKELSKVFDKPPTPDGPGHNEDAGDLEDAAADGELAVNAAQDVEDDQPVANVANQGQAGAANNSMQQPAIADPVQPSSGTYVHSETDLQLIYGEAVFKLERYYGSSYPYGWSLGRQWRFAGDSVVLRGVQSNARVDYNTIDSRLKEVEGLYEFSLSTYKAGFGSLADYTSTRQSWSVKLTAFEDLIASTDTAVVKAEAAVAACAGTIYSAAAAEVLRKARATRNQLAGAISNMQTSITALDKAYHAVGSLAADLQAVQALAAAALQTAKTAESRHTANSLALSSGWPAYFEEVGNANLSLISEQGSPVVFVPAGSGRFVAQDDPQQQQGVIVANGSGFVHQRRDGQNWHYNEYGLLTRISDRNGLGIDFNRDGNGRIQTITAGQRVVILRYEQGLLHGISASGGVSISYGYDPQKRLSLVTDASGDTVQYKYDGDYLTQIIKPDESFLRYDYITSAGRVVCERTKDEEEALERFEYDFVNRTTLYVDPADGEHRYWFDEKLRYAREEHPAGYYKTYQYDDKGNLIRTEEPGWVLTYNYDARGNRTHVYYQDSSYEQWTYDSNDLVSSYRDRDEIFYTYTRDTAGNLTSVQQGTVVTATYSWQNGRIATVNERGVQRSYGYDANGFIDTILWPDGSADRFENDAWGRPLVHTDRLNRQTVREYDKEGRVRVERFPGGLERRFTYDWRKDLTEVVELDTVTGASHTTVLKYDQRHLLIEKVVAAGVVSRYSYRADGKLESALLDGLWQSDYEYSPGGYLGKSTQSLVGQDGQYSESYEYDSMGRLTFVRRPLGRDSEYQYAHNGTLEAEVDALGRIQQYTYSAAGRLEASSSARGDHLDYRYEADGSLRSLSRPGKAADEVLLIKDQYGRIEERVDAAGSRWGYVYDNQGRLERETLNGQWYRSYRYDAVGRLLELRDGEDRVLEAWIYSADGRSAERLDGLGNASRVELDAWGRTLRLVDPEGRSRSFVYDGLGRVVQAVDGYGNSEYYEYNALGKLAKRTDREDLLTQYQYDHRGQLVRVLDALGTAWSGQYDAAGRLVAEQGRPGTEAAYQWDELDRLVSRSSGDQVLERFVYDDDANVVRREDARGSLSEQSLDEQGRVVAERSRGGYSATRSYDQAGRLHETVSYGGVRTLHTYDALGNVVWQQSDGEAPSTWSYDSVGRLLRAESPTGVLEYSYDAAGNLSTIKDHAAGETISYRYDRSGLRIAMTRGGSTVSYSYGQNGELLTLVDDGVSIRFAYDKAGRETARYYANGIRIETMYDPVGRIEAIREVRGSSGVILRAYGYVYDSRGRISFKIDERGRYTSYQYDSAGRLVQVLYPFDSGKRDADRDEAERLGLRVAGANPMAERQMINSETSQQLTQALTRALGFSRGSVGHQLSWSERFSYDANGNRLTKLTGWGILHYEYGADDQLLKAGVARFEYDRDGRLIEERDAKSMTSYQYDSSNRPILVTRQTLADASSETIRYSYDALGRRVERIVESSMAGGAGAGSGSGSGLTSGLGTRSLYDGFSFDETRSIAVRSDGSALPEYGQVASPGATSAGSRYRYWDEASGGFVGGGAGNASGAGEAGGSTSGGSTAANVIPGGRSRNLVQAYGQTVAVRSGGSVYYTGQDRLGSVESISNSDGSLLDRYEYDAFGGSIGGDVSSGLGLGYTGKPYDEFTGKYNYGFRDYAPEQARFSTVDPIRDGSNWYAYCNADPVNFIDLWGLLAGQAGQPTYFTQQQWKDQLEDVNSNFWEYACAATSVLNEVSERYTIQTNEKLTIDNAIVMMQAAIDKKQIAPNATIQNWAGAAQAMWDETGQSGTWSYSEGGARSQHAIYQVYTRSQERNGSASRGATGGHFVNSTANGYFETWGGGGGATPYRMNSINRAKQDFDYDLPRDRIMAVNRGVRNLWFVE